MVRRRGVPSLALALSRLRRPRPGVTLGGVVDSLADGAAVLLLLIAGGLAIIPIPGLPFGIVGGIVATLVALHMTISRPPLRLPQWVRSWRLRPALLEQVARRMVPLIRRLERQAKPRLARFATGLGTRLGYAMAAVQSILVSMPIPFGNTLPGVAIILLALGLSRRDGAVMLVGHAVGLVGIVWNVAVVTALVAAARLVV